MFSQPYIDSSRSFAFAKMVHDQLLRIPHFTYEEQVGSMHWWFPQQYHYPETDMLYMLSFEVSVVYSAITIYSVDKNNISVHLGLVTYVTAHGVESIVFQMLHWESCLLNGLRMTKLI